MEKSSCSDGIGLQCLYMPENPTVDIIAVHGLNGHSLSTWTSKKEGICWLNHPALLPEYAKSARVLSWGYNANTYSIFAGSASSDYILLHAQSLVAHLAAERELQNGRLRPIIFLCHSFGGIVVKRALAYAKDQKSPHVAHLHSIYVSTFGILFFGTPHFGSTKAKTLKRAQTFASIFPRKIVQTESNLVKALDMHSETLQNINDQFAPLIPRLRIYFFWEQRRTSFKYTQDYVVQEFSAAPVLDNTERCGIDSDHRGMCRFSSVDSPGFSVVASALRRYCQQAPSVVSLRQAAAQRLLASEMEEKLSELMRASVTSNSSDEGTHPHRPPQVLGTEPYEGPRKEMSSTF